MCVSRIENSLTWFGRLISCLSKFYLLHKKYCPLQEWSRVKHWQFASFTRLKFKSVKALICLTTFFQHGRPKTIKMKCIRVDMRFFLTTQNTPLCRVWFISLLHTRQGLENFSGLQPWCCCFLLESTGVHKPTKIGVKILFWQQSPQQRSPLMKYF